MADGQPQHNHNANDQNRWRLSKDIPISVVGFIVCQTIAMTWFSAGQNAKLNSLSEENQISKATQYTKEDARHEREFIEQKFITAENKNEEVTRRLALVEAQVAAMRSNK